MLLLAPPCLTFPVCKVKLTTRANRFIWVVQLRNVDPFVCKTTLRGFRIFQMYLLFGNYLSQMIES